MPSAPSSAPHANNLPALLSSFIGRKAEIGEVRQLLRTQRLVTLTGAGGCGKSRLALQVAASALPAFEEGVWLVELASLADPALVPQAVASALGVREQSGRPLVSTLSDYLRSRKLLLVLDNCEHLVQACAEVAATLLQACPALTILATSREPLNIDGETVWVVPPLSLPEAAAAKDTSGRSTAAAAQPQSEAVQLFVARAQAAAPGFTLTAENVVSVEEICRRLDGMPLAIELAAARLRALTVQQVAEHLDDRFHLLTGGSRTAPARHQTLEATLDWSYALLSEPERKVLQRLSVFAGGCNLQAATAVCSGEYVATGDVLDHLSHLVDKSLLEAETAHGEARYRMLETIREYALRRRLESEGPDGARNRHLEYFVGWAENADHQLRAGREQLEWMSRFEVEDGNLLTALEWSQLAEERAEAGLRLAVAAGYFWELRGFPTAARMRVSAALEHPGAQAKTAARAEALLRLSILAVLQSDYQAVLKLANQSLSIWRTMGAPGRLGVAETLEMSAIAESAMGDYAAALPHYEEALALFRDLEDPLGLGDTLVMLGASLMNTGKFEQAGAHFDEGLLVCRAAGDVRQIASTLANAGELAIRRGQYERGEQLLRESLENSRLLGHKWGIARELGSLGWLALARRDFAGATALLGESLTIRAWTGDLGGIAWCLEKLAQVAALLSHPERAAMFLGAAAALRARLNIVMYPVDRAEYDGLLSTIRAALGKQVFADRWSEGEAMPVERMVDQALRDVGPTPSEAARLEQERLGGLTGREREVAALIAQGRSNREIAAAMTVGIKTVETYVTRILNKLGFDSRVQIATWAVEMGLTASGSARQKPD